MMSLQISFMIVYFNQTVGIIESCLHEYFQVWILFLSRCSFQFDLSQLTGRRNVGNVEDSFDRVAFSQQNSFDREQPLVKRRVFQPLFLDRADINEVYRNIDSQKFTIIPAVPPIHLQRSEKSLVNSRTQDILFPSPQLKPIRNPKEQSIVQSKAPLETFQEQPKKFQRPNFKSTIQPSRPESREWAAKNCLQPWYLLLQKIW